MEFEGSLKQNPEHNIQKYRQLNKTICRRVEYNKSGVFLIDG
ncbi:hypothetical protein [Proteiniborus sp. DW1]|nr:hypothetical protein [Proteiniborus sp. DW1]